MFTTILRLLCLVFILIGLAWLYTLYYGGPFTPFFVRVAHHLPAGVQINLTPAPLNH